ncbi:MAG: DUF3343 domain-containing protein [Clostridia bacterium]|nr:DUF3343 domain-containing protein [Clostridia bacterium]
MNRYIAAFHTHLAAMRTRRALLAAGVPAEFAPVPRRLSASCGTCVLYSAETPRLDCMDADTAIVAQADGQENYQILFQNE